MAIQKNMNDELIAFVLSLTDEDVDTLVNRLPELISLLGESYQPCHQEQTLQTA